jgi:ferredoxin
MEIAYKPNLSQGGLVIARVTVDPDLCIGSGDCVRLAPSAFRLDDERGVSIPLETAPRTDPALLLAAARNCPTQAIDHERAASPAAGERPADER